VESVVVVIVAVAVAVAATEVVVILKFKGLDQTVNYALYHTLTSSKVRSFKPLLHFTSCQVTFLQTMR